MTTNNQLKVILVGCGSISRAWLRPATQYPGLQFVGLVDIFPESAAQRQEEFQLRQAKIGTDLGQMIEETGANIVFDCTVPEAHTEVTIEALRRGCHVLGEKPMAMSMDRAAMMIEAAQASGKLYAVIQNRRYADLIIRFRNFLQAGQLGRLHTLNADFYLGPHFGGFREEMAHVLLIDMAIHSFDQARFISGTDPVAVYCYEWNPPGSWYRHGASAMAIFEMSDGLIFNYRGSWSAEGLNTSWECAWRAQSERGSATWDGHDQFQAQAVASSEGFIREQQTLEIPPAPPLAQTGHGGVIYDFLDCVQHGGTPQTICTDNIKSLAMVHAAIESAETGRRVVIQIPDIAA